MVGPHGRPRAVGAHAPVRREVGARGVLWAAPSRAIDAARLSDIDALTRRATAIDLLPVGYTPDWAALPGEARHAAVGSYYAA